MSNATFETFLVSGLLVLIAAIGYLAWAAWRWVDRERDMEKLAVDGINHEMRLNLKRMMTELAGVANGTLSSDIEVIPVVHPQLDALLSRPSEADRRGLTIIRGNYNELSAHKQSLRAALSGRGDVGAAANVAVDAVIGSLSTLYLWEEHKGRPPEDANSTRSWDVRDWMKDNAFHSDLLPGLHLRDQVVERLRTDGMTLTPKPLTYTASEYYAKLYDRKSDPNAPFWKRKAAPVEEVETPETVEPIVDPVPKTVPETVVETVAEPQSTPQPEAPAPQPEAQAATEAPTETVPGVKPQTPGIVH
ncbi:MAG: hypothetical protein ABJH52_11810 [Henriciella sp.]